MSYGLSRKHLSALVTLKCGSVPSTLKFSGMMRILGGILVRYYRAALGKTLGMLFSKRIFSEEKLKGEKKKHEIGDFGTSESIAQVTRCKVR